MKAFKNASFKGKEKNQLPEGAEIIKKDVSLTVEEIENGYLIVKSYDIRYKLKDTIHYEYVTKKWYTKNNPMTIDLKAVKEKPLADKFE